MSDSDMATVARKLMYWLVSVQGLRDGDGVSPQLLAKGMEKHGITGDAEQAALDLAFSNSWLQKGPLNEIQLTKKGFGLDFGQ